MLKQFGPILLSSGERKLDRERLLCMYEPMNERDR